MSYADSNAVTNNWRDVKKWLIEVDFVPVKETPHANSGEIIHLYQRQAFHAIIAASVNNQFLEFAGHPNKEEHIDWSYEPFNSIISFKDGEVVTDQVFNRKTFKAPLPKGSQCYRYLASKLAYLIMPTWPLNDYPSPSADPETVMIAQAAMDSDKYEVLQKQELVAGEWCKVVQARSGTDRIWVSNDKELCVMRREWFSDMEKNSGGELITKAVREIAPGLWLPEEVEAGVFSLQAETGKRLDESRVKMRVLRCEIDDDVPAESFHLECQPGTIEVYENLEFKQISPGGTDHLVRIVEFFRAKPYSANNQSFSKNLYHCAIEFAFGAVLGMAMCAVFPRALKLSRSTG